MHFFVLAALFTAIIAAPANNVVRDVVCDKGLYSEPRCCIFDVLTVADLQCNAPDEVPRDFKNLQQICSKSGTAAACCAKNIAGQAALCK